MNNMFPRHFCYNGVSLTISLARGIESTDTSGKHWYNAFPYLNVSDISPPLDDVCDVLADVFSKYKTGDNTYDCVPLDTLMNLIANFEGMLCHVIRSDEEAQVFSEDEESKFKEAYKNLRKSTAKVYVKPLSKLQREHARSGSEVKESHFLSIKYPNHPLPCAWRYSKSELWVERPWLDGMISEDRAVEAFRMIINNDSPSSDEEPLINHDRTVNTPVYRIPMEMLRELSNVFFSEKEIEKILAAINEHKAQVISPESLNLIITDQHTKIPVKEFNLIQP